MTAFYVSSAPWAALVCPQGSWRLCRDAVFIRFRGTRGPSWDERPGQHTSKRVGANALTRFLFLPHSCRRTISGVSVTLLKTTRWDGSPRFCWFLPSILGTITLSTFLQVSARHRHFLVTGLSEVPAVSRTLNRRLISLLLRVGKVLELRQSSTRQRVKQLKKPNRI